MSLELFITYIGFLSSIIGILWGIYNIIKSIKAGFKKTSLEKLLPGKWFSYNHTKIKNEKVIVDYELNIKYNWLRRKYTGVCISLRDDKIRYNVTIFIKVNNVYLIYDSIHDGEMVLIIYRPVWPFETSLKMEGLGLGLSYDNSLISSMAVLQKDKPNREAIDIDEFKRNILEIKIK